jgi:hypothetical protein
MVDAELDHMIWLMLYVVGDFVRPRKRLRLQRKLLLWLRRKLMLGPRKLAERRRKLLLR